MKNKIEQIILKAIGEDTQQSNMVYLTNPVQYPKNYSREYVDGYNEAKAELRTKAPEIAQEILDSVVGEMKGKIKTKRYKLIEHHQLDKVDSITIPDSYESAFELGRDISIKDLINHLTK
jgi:hypothetical protein